MMVGSSATENWTMFQPGRAVALAAMLVFAAGCGEIEDEPPVADEAVDRQGQELFVDFQRYYEPPEEDYFEADGITTTPDRLEDGHAPMVIDENVLKFSTYALDHVEVESDALHFPREGFEELLELTSGDVVISELRRADFWREVTSVEPRADEIVVNTREAQFTQVVISGDFHLQVEPDAPILDEDLDLMDPYLKPRRVRQLQQPQQQDLGELDNIDDELVEEILTHDHVEMGYVHYPPSPPRQGLPDDEDHCFSQAFQNLWDEVQGEDPDYFETDYIRDRLDGWPDVGRSQNSWLSSRQSSAWEGHQDIFDNARVDMDSGKPGSGCHDEVAVREGEDTTAQDMAANRQDFDDGTGRYSWVGWDTYTDQVSAHESWVSEDEYCSDPDNRAEDESYSDCMPDDICNDGCAYRSSTPDTPPTIETSDDFRCGKYAAYDQFVEESVRMYYANNTSDDLSADDLNDLDLEVNSVCDAVEEDDDDDGATGGDLSDDEQGTLASLIETYIIDSILGMLIPGDFGNLADLDASDALDYVKDPMCERSCRAAGCEADDIGSCSLDALFDEDGELESDDPDDIRDILNIPDSVAVSDVYDVSDYEECMSECWDFTPCISATGQLSDGDFDFITTADTGTPLGAALQCDTTLISGPECGPEIEDQSDWECDPSDCNESTGQCETGCDTVADCDSNHNYCEDGQCLECKSRADCEENCFGGECTGGMTAEDHLDMGTSVSVDQEVCFDFHEFDLDAEPHFDFGISVSMPSPPTSWTPSLDFEIDMALETDLEMDMEMTFGGGISLESSARLDVPAPPPFSFSVGKIGMGFHAHTELSFGISISGETAVQITSKQHQARGASVTLPFPMGVNIPDIDRINVDCYEEPDHDYCEMIDPSEDAVPTDAGTEFQRGGSRGTLSVNAGVAMGINFKMIDPTILDTLADTATDAFGDAVCPTASFEKPSVREMLADMTTEIVELEAKVTAAAEFTVAPPDCYYDAGLYLSAYLDVEFNYPLISGAFTRTWFIIDPTALFHWHGDLLDLPGALPAIPDDALSFLEPYCGSESDTPPPPEFEDAPQGCNEHGDCTEQNMACGGGTMCVENDGLRATLDWGAPADLSLVANAVDSANYGGELFRASDDSAQARDVFTFWQCGGLCEGDDIDLTDDDASDEANRYIENATFDDAQQGDEFTFYVDVVDRDPSLQPGDVIDYVLEIEYEGEITRMSGMIEIGQDGEHAPVSHGYCVGDVPEEECLENQLMN